MQPPLPINLESVYACRVPLKPDSAFATVLLLCIIVLTKWIKYCHLADQMNLELEHLVVDGVYGFCLKKLPPCGTAVVIFFTACFIGAGKFWRL